MKRNTTRFIATSLFLVFALLGCKQNENPKPDYFTVHFYTCTDLETNVIEDQHLYLNDLVDEPVLITPMQVATQKVSGWYTSSDYTTKWDFANDTVKGDLNLYAKWSDILNIYYYLKGQNTPIWTVTDACVDEPLERHDELCDGYTFNEGYYQDPECTVKFDLTKPLKEDTIVYMDRGDVLDLNPGSIKRRFSMYAAGGSGSTAGSISIPGVDAKGDEYVDVNFGYSTTADPYMQINMVPSLDISKSQKLEFQFKNFGSAASFTLYWVTKYANGDYAGDTSYYNGNNSKRINLTNEQMKMTEDDDWAKVEVDLTTIVKDGVKTWANSAELVKLRLQFGYVSKSQTDLSNVVRFKSIMGISDPESVGFKDSKEISDITKNDDATKISEAADKQSDISHGLIFPKNNSKLNENVSRTFFKKTDGLLLYSEYRKTDVNYKFTFNDTISCNDYSYLRVRLGNYSFISSLDVLIITRYNGNSKNTTGSFALSSRLSNGTDYYLNLYEMKNFLGTVESLELSFNTRGVDNAILLKEIQFMESTPFQVPGINLNDNNFAGLSSTSDIALSRDVTVKGTNFVVNKAASIETDYNNELDVSLFSKINVSFFYNPTISQQLMNEFTVSIKTGDTYKDYKFSGIYSDNNIQTVSLDFKGEGLITGFKIAFNNKCSIVIRSITFNMDEYGTIDFSNSLTYVNMLADWKEGSTYDTSLSCLVYNSPTKMINYYFGDRYAGKYRSTGNIQMMGKKYMYLMYQKTDVAKDDKILLRLKGLKKTQTSSYNTSTIVSEEIFNEYVELENTTSTGWRLLKLEIDPSYTTGDIYYGSMVMFTFIDYKPAVPCINIRAIAVR